MINLDALMVHDIIDPDDTFDRDPSGAPGDEILFSISQLVDPADPSGYYATGSEIFYLNASGFDGILLHGGHLWDKAYALADMTTAMSLDGQQRIIQHDLNALEAVADVPEPGAWLLALVAAAVAAGARSRRREN
jgi:hypothetical protein